MSSDFLINYHYDYNNNILQVSTQHVSFDLELRAPITVIRGDSATGKTLLFNTLQEVQKMYKNMGYRYTGAKVTLFDDHFVRDDSTGLIVIDRAEMYLTDELCNWIRNCTKSRFLIMSRKAFNLGLTPNYYATIKQQNNHLSLDYKFSEEAWFV